MTLEKLENDYWEPLKSYPTKLIEDIYLLRKKELVDFDPDDYRVLISQNIGLKFLVPKVIVILNDNILLEALYYPGDLLLSLLKIDKNYWEMFPDQKEDVMIILEKAKERISKTTIISDSIREELFSAITSFSL